MQKPLTAYRQGIFWLLVLMLVFAPLFRAGNLPLPLLLLELIALCILVLMLMRPRELLRLNAMQLVLLGGMLLLPLLMLVPVPAALWQQLPGREAFSEIYQAIGMDGEAAWRAISLAPYKTEGALWALLPPLAVFAAVINQPQQNILKLVYVALGMAVFQSVLSLMQYGGGSVGFLYIPNEFGIKAAAGTYLNRDHLAGFLEMLFPVALALLAATVGQHRFDSVQGAWRKRLSFLATAKGHQASVYAVIGILAVLCLVFTRSRAGIALTMLGLFLLLLVFARRLGGNNVYGTYGTVIAVILVLTVEIGLAPILDRFSMDPVEDARWSIYATSMQGAVEYFPVGAGPGAYPEVYPYFQPVGIDAFVNHAHNDYLEWVFDGGILALFLVLAGLGLYALGWRRLWIKGRWRTFRYVQAGAGIGVFLLMLHSFVDFNLHKPANAIYFALLLAVFLKENKEEMALKERASGKTRTRRLQVPAASVPVVQQPRNGVSLDDW
ncbi:O-antigen ligase family protein [Thiolapillus sp.]